MAPSMPNTLHGMIAGECISALQKAIRRAQERRAMEFACELVNTSKSYCSIVCRRLEIISHEDIDSVAHPAVVPYVATACGQARAWYRGPDPGDSRMAIGNAVRLLCRTPKSRLGDHFQAAIGLRNLIKGETPLVPDEALDMHTTKGRAMKRGLTHFRNDGARLAGDPPPPPDEYEDEAYEMWALKRAGTVSGTLWNGNHPE